MNVLRKVRVQLLDEQTNEVIEEVDVMTSATSVVFSDGETFQQKLEKGKLNGPPGANGLQGSKGDKGDPFSISKVYTSISQMNADYNNSVVKIGEFVLIDTGNVEDIDNAKLYAKGVSTYQYITDLSGTQGMQGPQGSQGIQGPEGQRGIQGERGLQGQQGIQGERGPQGEKGADGSGINIRGSFTSTSQLPSNGDSGDAYIVNGDLYVWTGTGWDNVGRIQGPQGIQGIKGDIGAQGIQGPKGDTGATGQAGNQGPQGPKGDDGDTVRIGTTFEGSTQYKLFFKVVG